MITILFDNNSYIFDTTDYGSDESRAQNGLLNNNNIVNSSIPGAFLNSAYGGFLGTVFGARDFIVNEIANGLGLDTTSFNQLPSVQSGLQAEHQMVADNTLPSNWNGPLSTTIASDLGSMVGSTLPAMGAGGLLGDAIKGGASIASDLAVKAMPGLPELGAAMADSPLGATAGAMVDSAMSNPMARRVVGAMGGNTVDTAGQFVGNLANGAVDMVSNGAAFTAPQMGQLMDQMIQNGYSQSDAVNATNSVGLPMLGLNTAMMGAFKAGLGNIGSSGLLGAIAGPGESTLAGRLGEGVINTATMAGIGGAQGFESANLAEQAQNQQTGSLFNPSSWTQAETNAFYGGALPMGLIGAIGGVKHTLTGGADATTSMLDDDNPFSKTPEQAQQDNANSEQILDQNTYHDNGYNTPVESMDNENNFDIKVGEDSTDNSISAPIETDFRPQDVKAQDIDSSTDVYTPEDILPEDLKQDDTNPVDNTRETDIDNPNAPTYTADETSLQDRLDNVNQAIQDGKDNGSVNPMDLREKVDIIAQSDVTGEPIENRDDEIASTFADNNQGKKIVSQVGDEIKYNSDVRPYVAKKLEIENDKLANTDDETTKDAINQNIQDITTNEKVRQAQAIVNQYQDNVQYRTDSLTGQPIITADTASVKGKTSIAQKQLMDLRDGTPEVDNAVANGLNSINSMAQKAGVPLKDTYLGVQKSRAINNNNPAYSGEKFKGKAQYVRQNAGPVRDVTQDYKPSEVPEIADNNASQIPAIKANNTGDILPQDKLTTENAIASNNSLEVGKSIPLTGSDGKPVSTSYTPDVANVHEGNISAQNRVGYRPEEVENKPVEEEIQPQARINANDVKNNNVIDEDDNVWSREPDSTTSMVKGPEPAVVETPAKANADRIAVNGKNAGPNDLAKEMPETKGVDEKAPEEDNKSLGGMKKNHLGSPEMKQSNTLWARIVTPLTTRLKKLGIDKNGSLARLGIDCDRKATRLSRQFLTQCKTIMEPIMRYPAKLKQYNTLFGWVDTHGRELVQWRLLPGSKSGWIRLNPEDVFERGYASAEDAQARIDELRGQGYKYTKIYKDTKDPGFIVVATKKAPSIEQHYIGDNKEVQQAVFKQMQNRSMADSKARAMANGIDEDTWNAYSQSRDFYDTLREMVGQNVAKYDLTGQFMQGRLTGYFPHIFDKYKVMCVPDDGGPARAIRSFQGIREAQRYCDQHQGDFEGHSLKVDKNPVSPELTNPVDEMIDRMNQPDDGINGQGNPAPFKNLSIFLQKAFPEIKNDGVITSQMIKEKLNDADLMKSIGLDADKVAQEYNMAKNLKNAPDKAGMISMVNNYGAQFLRNGHDVSRKFDSQGYNRDYANVMGRYAVNCAHRIAMTPFYFEATKRYYEVTGKTYSKKNLDLSNPVENQLNDFINAVQGKPAKFDKAFNEFMNKTPLLGNWMSKYCGDDWATKGLNYDLQFQTVAKLGCFNVSSAFAQLAQLQNVFAKSGPKEMMEAAAYVMNNGWKKDPVMRRIYQELDLDNRWNGTTLDTNTIGGLMSSRPGGINVGGAVKDSMTFFYRSDRFVREISAIIGYRKAKAAGLNEEDCITAAKNFTDETNFVFGHYNDPGILRNFGTLGKVIGQFARFGFLQWDYIANHCNWTERAKLAGAVMATSGLFGLPVTSNLNDIVTSASKAAGLNNGLGYNPQLAIKKQILELTSGNPSLRPLAMGAMYGAAATIPGGWGVDLSQKMGQGSLFRTGSWTDILGPTVSTAASVYKALNADARPQAELLSALHAVLPVSTNIYQGVTGENYNWSHALQTQPLTWQQRVMKMLGFTSADASLANDTGEVISNINSEFSAGKKQVVQQYINNPTPETQAGLSQYGVTDKQIKDAQEAFRASQQQSPGQLRAGRSVKSKNNNSPQATNVQNQVNQVMQFSAP